MARTNDQGQVLFPMKYIVTTCGVSRATLLRYEEEGLLTPAFKDDDSGYRYYSCENLADILNILKYQHLGFTKKEIREIQEDPRKLSSGIESLRQKHLVMLRELDNLTADLAQGTTGEGKDSPLPGLRIIPTFGGTFFTRTKEVLFTPDGMRGFAVETLEDFLRARIPGNTQQTMKVYVDDADYRTCIGQFDGKKHVLRAVIPTLHPEVGEDIIGIPPCTMLTLAVKCDYDRSEPYFRALWDKAKTLGYTPDGPVCIAGLPDLFAKAKENRGVSTLRLMLRTTAAPDDATY
ncbi:MAG: MerR family transcriptional regulator [Clostridiales bacterium]|nr:MerR family transcriptional regulator [Clostridiales bacterium]